jgi:hypothetical protein
MVGVPHLSGKQKIYSALLILACEPGKIEQRLEAAYRFALTTLDAQLDLPPQYAGEYMKIRDELQKAFLFSSHRNLDSRQWATDLASRIVALYDKLARTK